MAACPVVGVTEAMGSPCCHTVNHNVAHAGTAGREGNTQNDKTKQLKNVKQSVGIRQRLLAGLDEEMPKWVQLKKRMGPIVVQIGSNPAAHAAQQHSLCDPAGGSRGASLELLSLIIRNQ